MRAAKQFVLPSWRPAFDSIEDASEVLVAGTSAWARVTHVRLEKKLLRRRPKPKQVTEEPAELAYYVVTAAGLHVGQDRPRHVKPSRADSKEALPDAQPGEPQVTEPQFTGPQSGARLDYFVPREAITSVARWEVGSGGVMAKVALGGDGACVDIRFVDPDRQFSGNTEGELPAVGQRENVIRALIDGVAPIVETATKVCPDCAENVKVLANVCRFCGYRFDGSPPPRGSMLKVLAARVTERIAEQPRFGQARLAGVPLRNGTAAGEPGGDEQPPEAANGREEPRELGPGSGVEPESL